jgi:DNA mismatch repair protein MutS2
MKDELDLLKKKIEEDKLEYERKLIEIEREKNEILKEAYKKAEEMMSEMQSKAAGLIEKISREDSKKEDLKEVQRNLNQLRTTITTEKREKVVEKAKVEVKIDFVEGEKVFVKSLNQFASVIKINKNKESAIVQAGILKMELPLNDMKKAEEDKKKVYAAAGLSRARGVKYEIDVRGKMVDEAIHEIEAYFDSAILSGYNEVYVIHGKGTGALREGILKYLKNSRYVKEFRIGGHNEGGLGCTVVTLK